MNWKTSCLKPPRRNTQNARHSRQRGSQPQTSTPVELYTRPHRFSLGERRVFSRRHLPSTLCFLAAAAIVLTLVALPLAAASFASPQDSASARAATEARNLVATSPDLARSTFLEVGNLLQNPELPTGCESVALANALVAQGFPLTNTELADTWLPKSETDFVQAFNSHCVTVHGYDLDTKVILASDPLRGFTAYDLELFATRYYQMGAQAVVVK